MKRHLLFGYIESYIKLQMFKAVNRFHIMSIEESPLKNSHFHRCFIRFGDKYQNRYFEGMAESEIPSIARLKAFAEAYERACFFDFQKILPKEFDVTLPYGLGVGFRKSAAIRRAFGEYYEHLTYSEAIRTLNSNYPIEKIFSTPVGEIHVFIERVDSLVYGGYGNSKKTAKDSAMRSFIRMKDYDVQVQHFEQTKSHPIVKCITFEKNPWLECYFVGHQK